MKRRASLCLICILSLLALAACGGAGTASGSVSDAEPRSSQLEADAALTAEDVAALYPSQPDSFPNFLVEEIIPYGEDFLVVRRAEHGSGETILDWVFASGQQAVLWSGYSPSYTVLGPGVVQVESEGKSNINGWQGMPDRTTCIALEGQNSIERLTEDVLLSLEQGWTIGWPIPEPRDSADGVARYEQLYDARVGLTDLQLSFIPSGDSITRFGSFFTAATSVPTAEASFDPDSRLFALRLYNTCLSSGGISQDDIFSDIYRGLYPYSFPSGILEGDSGWLSNVRTVQDGEDTLVTATLAPAVQSYRIEWGNLGDDTIPWLRVEFSTQESSWN